MITEWDKAYVQLAEAVMSGQPHRGHRSTKRIYATHAQTVIQEGLPLLTLRDVFPRTACNEAVACLSALDVPPNMGHRFRIAMNVDQWLTAIHLLKSDDKTRRAYIHCWNPAEDLWIPELGGKRPKWAPDMPAWHLWCADGRLNISVFQRTCDVWNTLPITVIVVGLIHTLIAKHLELECGTIFVAVSHAYIYEEDRTRMRQLIARYVERSTQRGGTNPNHAITLEVDTLPAALKGQAWVAHDLALRVDEFYENVKGEPIG